MAATRPHGPQPAISSDVKLRTLALALLAAVLHAQSTPSQPTDPLGRTSPQDAILHFLETAHKHDYNRAAAYLDLRKMDSTERAKFGPQLAHQLEDLLDDTNFDIATLSRDPGGDESDNRAPNFDELYTVHVHGQTIDLQIERIELRPGIRLWLVSSASVAKITNAHQAVVETAFEKNLPQPLVTIELFDTPIWRWIALILMGAVIWILTTALIWALAAALRRFTDTTPYRAPARAIVATGLFGIALAIAEPSTLPRLIIERALGLAFFLSVAWFIARIIDHLAERWSSHLDSRTSALSYSILPLGRQIAKLTLYVITVLGVIHAWGYETNTIIAGLGVGGLAVALAAQKTIENLFGGVSVISDRPVLVGDTCRFDGRVGTVMHIGLRSTRIRTPDRTIISVPNAQFSSMTLENISGRDKVWFHPVLNLRRDTTTKQMNEVLASFAAILKNQAKMEAGKIPVRFINVGSYSLDVEINGYVLTEDYDEFLAIQQDILLQFLQAIEKAGTALAVPLTETFQPARPEQS